jgi:hypothetical protein
MSILRVPPSPINTPGIFTSLGVQWGIVGLVVCSPWAIERR